MRQAALLLLLFIAAGCAGDEEPLAETAGPAQLDVQIVAQGKRTWELQQLRAGRLAGAGDRETAGPTVFTVAGDEPDRQSIQWEEVYLRGPDGTTRRLTDDRRGDFAPRLLRDGRVAFVSCPLDVRGVVPDCSLDAIDPEDGSRETLVDGLGIVFDGELSPDEQRLLFTRLDPRSGAPLGLFVRDVGSDDERRLVDGSRGTWSPDGRRIAFVSDRNENGPCLFHDCLGHAGEIYVADADGGDERRLTENPESDAAPEWSPDGEWIVLARIPDENDDWDLYAVRADGECERQLTDTPRWETAAVWHGAGDGGLSC